MSATVRWTSKVLDDLVRRLIASKREVRYARVRDEAVILRLWHTREDR